MNDQTRMSDDRLAEYVEAAESVKRPGAMERLVFALKAERQAFERVLMSRGRKDAMLAVFMSAIAAESRKGRTEWAKGVIKRADEAAMKVKREHIHTAQVNSDEKEGYWWCTGELYD